MKKLLCFFCLVLSMHVAKSQSLNAGLGYGAGYFYIVEVLQDQTDFRYNAPWVMSTHLSFSPTNSYFDLGFQMQYASLETEFDAVGNTIFGTISSLNLGMLLEHVQDSNSVNLGYAFGLGINRESFESGFQSTRVNMYSTVTLQGIAEFPLSKRSSILLRPQLLWSDPINTFLPNRWVQAGEDLNAMMTIEFNYSFGKSY